MVDSSLAQRLLKRLTQLYEDPGPCLKKLLQLAEEYGPRLQSVAHRGWDERDVVLITYGDQIRAKDQRPLQTLRRFLLSHDLDKAVHTVHLLPFFPYSSDDGFSVIDYRAVDPALGNWEDVREIGRPFDLMFDLVLNHVSRRSRWFEEYIAGRDPYAKYFIEMDPRVDLSGVTRPRSSPLLTEVETSGGPRRLWTTFSPDQVDLNFANPDVLVEMADILLFYVEQGARIIRLDAVAYLWKEPGTQCIHLPQTHAVVKLLRDLLEAIAPGVILLTETNVPHEENVCYFGSGDEAQMVYQFSLPPLLLEAFLSRDAGPLVHWLSKLEPCAAGTTYFNFTASHDGVGVRPLEGLIPQHRLTRLVDAVKARGGMVSTRRHPDGTESPYELNVSYLSALREPGMSAEAHARRFLASQAIMLALRGIPGIYFHSLVGTENDLHGVEQTGEARRINRRKFKRDELEQTLADRDSLASRVFQGYRKMLLARIQQPAFHPDAPQEVWPLDSTDLICLKRCSLDGKQHVLVVANLGDQPRRIDLSQRTELQFTRDLLSGQSLPRANRVDLKPDQVAWLAAEN